MTVRTGSGKRLGELERHTDARIAGILTGLDEGLGFEEIAARGGTNVENVKNWFATWETVANGRVPTGPSLALHAARLVRFVGTRAALESFESGAV
jgi:hypothetical protein